MQLASEKASSDMFSMIRDGRARENLQERRIEAMHVGITEFLERCDPAHLAASRPLDAPTASTPYTPSTPTGVPSRLRPDFDFQPSPVGQDESTEPSRSTDSRIRDRNNAKDMRTRDHDDARDTHTRDRDDIRDTRIREHNDTGTHASEITTTLEICATTTSTTLEIGAGISDPTNGLHTKMIEGIAVTCSETHTIVE